MEQFTLLSGTYRYEQIRDRICIRVINQEHYRKELEHLMFIPWEDLAVIFYYLDPEAGSDHPLFRTDLDNWGLNPYELLRQAATQSRILHPPIFKTMREILQMPPAVGEEEIPLYVLTCKEEGYGAASMLYPGLLAEIAEQLKGDLYVVPSSVHELILLQTQRLQEPQGLISIIADVNRTVVLPGDFLSDSLYVYRRRKGELERYKGKVRLESASDRGRSSLLF